MESATDSTAPDEPYSAPAEADAASPVHGQRLVILRRIIVFSAIAVFFYVFKPIAAIYACLILSIAVHELGHLIAGLLCGYSLVSIRIGAIEIRHLDLSQVPPVEKWNLQLSRFAFHWLSGATRMLPIRYPLPRLLIRHVIFILGGLFANVAAILLALPIARLDTGVGAAAKGFIALSGLLIVSNVLIPSARRGLETDGLQLIRLLFSRSRRRSHLFLLTLVGRVAAIRQFASIGDLGRSQEELQSILSAADELIDSTTDPAQQQNLAGLRDAIRNGLTAIAAASARSAFGKTDS